MGQRVIRGTRQGGQRIPRPPPRDPPGARSTRGKAGGRLEPVVALRFRRTDLYARRGRRTGGRRAAEVPCRTCAQGTPPAPPPRGPGPSPHGVFSVTLTLTLAPARTLRARFPESLKFFVEMTLPFCFHLGTLHNFPVN